MKNQDVGNKDGCNNYMERKKLIQEMTVFFDEDNRTFSLSYQVYVYDYIHSSKCIKVFRPKHCILL